MRSVWRAELRKIATVRGQWIGAVLAALALPLTSLLVTATGGLSGRDTATSGAATGSVVALLAFGAWAAALSAGEYAQQTMVVSLTTVPRRSVFYGAKLGALAAVAGAAGFVSTAAALLVVRAVSAPGTHTLGNPAALLSVVMALVAVTVIGAAVGILTRSPTASIAIVFGVVLLPKLAGGLLGGMQPWVVGASPGTVVTQIVGGAQLTVTETFPAGTLAAAVTLLLAASVVGAAGGLALARRDG